MINFTNSIQIDRPIGEVYAYLSDLENTPKWNWAITATKKTTPGPASVGTRYRQTRSVPQPGTEILEITALETNQLIEVRGTLAQFSAHLSYHLDDHTSRTEVTNTVILEAKGALRLVAPALRRQIKRAVADNLNELRAQLETRDDVHRTAIVDDAS